MGNFETKFITQLDLNKIMSQVEFEKIIMDKDVRKGFHRQMVKENKWGKIYICERISDEEKSDPDFIENCEVDDICESYLNQYYVAQLKTIQKRFAISIADAVHGYHFEWAYGFDIYEYDRLNPNHKRLVLTNYHVCDYYKRETYHMSDDFIVIFDIIKKLNPDMIAEARVKKIENDILREKTKKLIKECQSRKISLY